MSYKIELVKDAYYTNYFLTSSVPNTSDKIFALVRELAGNSKTVKTSDVLERCISKGYKPDQVNICIEEYEELNVWQVNQTRSKITFM